jgi:hypothetical protein
VEHIVHEGNSGGRSVAQFKSEECEFEEPVACSERCFGNGFFIQPNLKVAGTKVDHYEDLCAIKSIKYIINAR